MMEKTQNSTSLHILLLSLFCFLFSLTSFGQSSTLISPEILEDSSVIFRLKAPSIDSVKISGTWPSTYDYVHTMTKKDSIFEFKIGPLPSGMYEYSFIIDGFRVLDPNNNSVTRDGQYIENRLIVPGTLADLADAARVPHGRVQTLWYTSTTLNTERRIHIYTPPGYNKNNDNYPVLYLLHGGGGDEDGWLIRGRANYILDNLIASKQATPMIVVMTNGNPNNTAAPLNQGYIKNKMINASVQSMASKKFEESFVKDVVPFIDENFRTIPTSDNRALSGFSMGGYQTQNITNANPALFKYIGVMSMGLFSSFQGRSEGYNKDKHISQLKTLQKNNPKLYWVFMGKKDFLYETGVALNKLYKEVDFDYKYIEDNGRHDWYSWRKYLSSFAPELFKK